MFLFLTFAAAGVALGWWGGRVPKARIIILTGLIAMIVLPWGLAGFIWADAGEYATNEPIEFLISGMVWLGVWFVTSLAYLGGLIAGFHFDPARGGGNAPSH